MTDGREGASASWRGWYLYAPGGRRHPMRLELAFRGDVVTGSGVDHVGAFTIRGGFDPAGVRVWWTKRYAHCDAVEYDGVRDGAGSRVVYGGWRIGAIASGGFKIWRASESGDATVRRESVELAPEERLAKVGIR